MAKKGALVAEAVHQSQSRFARVQVAQGEESTIALKERPGCVKESLTQLRNIFALHSRRWVHRQKGIASAEEEGVAMGTRHRGWVSEGLRQNREVHIGTKKEAHVCEREDY